MKSSKLAIAIVSGCLLLGEPSIAQTTWKIEDPKASGSSTLAERIPYAEKIVELMHYRRLSEQWRNIYLDPVSTPKCNCRSSNVDKVRVTEAWHQAVRDVFDIDQLLKSVTTQIARSLEISEMSEWIAYYETDLGQRIYNAERPEKHDINSRDEWAKILSSSKVLLADTERSSLLDRFITRSKHLDFMVANLTSLQLANVIGTKAFSITKDQDIDIHETAALIEKIQKYILAQYAPMLAPAVEPHYRSLSNSELQTYINELSKPNSQKIIGIIFLSHEVLLRNQAIAIGQRFGKIMQETKL